MESIYTLFGPCGTMPRTLILYNQNVSGPTNSRTDKKPFSRRDWSCGKMDGKYRYNSYGSGDRAFPVPWVQTTSAEQQ